MVKENHLEKHLGNFIWKISYENPVIHTCHVNPVSKFAQKTVCTILPFCQKYTPTDCFFGDFATSNTPKLIKVSNTLSNLRHKSSPRLGLSC